jgi:hypothetical protein
MAVLSVSDGELRRFEVLRNVDRGGLPLRAAAQLLGRSERQVWRLLKEFRAAGAAGLVSQAAIVENKQLGAALAFIRDQQLRREPEHRSDRAPRRRDQHNPRLFKVG